MIQSENDADVDRITELIKPADLPGRQAAYRLLYQRELADKKCADPIRDQCQIDWSKSIKVFVNLMTMKLLTRKRSLLPLQSTKDNMAKANIIRAAIICLMLN